MKADYLLSLCVATFNRTELLLMSIDSINNAVLNIKPEHNIQLVISDNSEHSRIEIINKFLNNNKSQNLELTYIWNQGINIGVDANVLNAVNFSSGEFCWILGDDDFILPYSLNLLLQELQEKNNTDMYFLNKLHYNLDSSKSYGQKKVDIKSIFDSQIKEYDLNKTIIISGSIWDFVSSENSYMGAMMLMVFRKKNWDIFTSIQNKLFESDKSPEEIFNMYPQTIIFGFLYSHSECKKILNNMVIIGEGVREWSTGKYYSNIWNSKELVINMLILPQLILFYEKNGMPLNLSKKLKSELSFHAGFYFLPYVIKRVVSFNKISNIQYINTFKSFKLNKEYLNFYFGMIRGFLSIFVLSPFRRIIHNRTFSNL